MYIPLFDIDGTLLKGGGGNQAHKNGGSYAFRTVYGLDDKACWDNIITDGKIDKQIILEVVEKNGISHKKALAKLDEAIDATTSYYLEHSNEGTCIAADGAIELLEELQKQNVPLGLLTGNIEAIGIDKLSKAGLAKYFEFGAFGNLALRRVDLIEIARERAIKLVGLQMTTSKFMIIGDSTLDVKCAKDGNIPVIGVSTAKSSSQELAEAGADLVVESLLQKDDIVKFILD
ncbi:MAG: hypothetical protein COY80_00710 [Candidatus Pacebacteria bacterium CG_4_10_14_0_8_um_filter_42_14]|nr:MAG: hypothetical protein COY80_00710 [Candidatus Pacebacteria bacterium CG_4_10_14_0_8_um_filter_42_14]